MNQRIELLEKSKAKIISLKYAKQYLRIDHIRDDEMINDMIDTATEVAEKFINRAIQQSKWKLTIYHNIPSYIKLFYGPISYIDKIKLFKSNDEFYYLNSGQYHLLTDNETLVINKHLYLTSLEIEYYNGYKKGQVPASIKQGILEHLARLYDSRGGDYIMPMSSKNLYQPYRKIRI